MGLIRPLSFSRPVQCLRCGLLRLGEDGVTAVPESSRTKGFVTRLVDKPRAGAGHEEDDYQSLRIATPVPFTCYVSAYDLSWDYNDERNTGEDDGERWYLALRRPRDCASFVRHTAGLSCADHLAGKQRASERREERLWTAGMTLAAAGVGGIFTLIAILVSQR